MQFDIEVLTAVLLKIQVLCVLMPCRLVDVLLGVLDPEDEGGTVLRNVIMLTSRTSHTSRHSMTSQTMEFSLV